MNRVEMRFLSLADNVGLARIAAAALAGQANFSIHDIEEIKVAVSEAVSNAVIHGYENRPDGWLQLTLELHESGMTILVHDCGVAIADTVLDAYQHAYVTDPT